MGEEVLLRAAASPLRRWTGVATLALIGLLAVYVALARPPEPLWQAFLLGLGAVALWLAEAMRRATEGGIELTEAGLRDSRGEIIVALPEVVAVERGAFAFKPSHGFLVRTRSPGARAWRPGLWWRLGRRVGVGGVVPGGQAKAMSEMLSVMLARQTEAAGGEDGGPEDAGG